MLETIAKNNPDIVNPQCLLWIVSRPSDALRQGDCFGSEADLEALASRSVGGWRLSANSGHSARLEKATFIDRADSTGLLHFDEAIAGQKQQ
jgi:hypothetical protein